MAEKKNPTVRERLATIEVVVKDIKDNHLKAINDRIANLSNRLWWLLGILVLVLLGIVLRK